MPDLGRPVGDGQVTVPGWAGGVAVVWPVVSWLGESDWLGQGGRR
jgi:hypothetical protein